MPSVKNIIGLLEKMESRDVTVHEQRCIMVRNRNATCGLCAQACTTGCISYHENELSVAPEKCIGCGTCATVCPTCALEIRRPNDTELMQACIKSSAACNGEAVIVCEQMLNAAINLCDTDKIVGVKCLGRIDESLVVGLATNNLKGITLVRGNCDECEHGICLNTANSVCNTANTLFETWGCDLRAHIQDKLPKKVRKKASDTYDHSKREFFIDFKNDAKDAASVIANYAAEETLNLKAKSDLKANPNTSSNTSENSQIFIKVGSDGTLPHFVPDRRERLLDFLATLGDPQDELIETRLWGHVIIDSSKCSSCQMCATFCPTGAISKFSRNDGTFGVEHAPSDCVKCQCCMNICPNGAITISDEVFALDLLQGVVEQYEMKPIEHPHGSPQSILYSLKDLMGDVQLYER